MNTILLGLIVLLVAIALAYVALIKPKDGGPVIKPKDGGGPGEEKPGDGGGP